MNDKIKDGGPAFPVPGMSGLPNDQCVWPEYGMTLRDYFAAKAMQGIISVEHGQDAPPDAVAKVAFNIADSMLNARNHKVSKPEFDPVLLGHIYDLELPERANNCLMAFDIDYIGDLIQRTGNELFDIPGMGWKSIGKIREALSLRGLRLGTKLENWPPSSISSTKEVNND